VKRKPRYEFSWAIKTATCTYRHIPTERQRKTASRQWTDIDKAKGDRQLSDSKMTLIKAKTYIYEYRSGKK